MSTINQTCRIILQSGMIPYGPIYMIDKDSIYFLSRDFVVDERDEKIEAVLNLSTGDAFRLENSGKDILFLLVQGRSLEQTVDRLCELYDAEESILIRDVYSIVEQFVTMGVLEKGTV